MDEHFGWNERLLPSVIFTEQEKRETIFADMICRFYGLVKLFGEDGRKFMEELIAGECGERVFLKVHFDSIKGLPLEVLEKMAEEQRRRSLLIFALNLTGECQMNCGICYTNRRKRKDELSWEETENLLKQAKEMGARTVYVAGEGEPLLDRNFMKIAGWCRTNDLKFHVFTNGLALSGEDYAEEFCRRNGLNDQDLKRKHDSPSIIMALIRELREYPIYFYFKLWATDPAIHRKMTNIDIEHDHPWLGVIRGDLLGLSTDEVKYIFLPLGLMKLIREWPHERVGVQTTPTKLNWKDVLTNIIPLIEKWNLRAYIEPLIHSGRNEGNPELDLTLEQNAKFARYYVRQDCVRVRWKQVISSTGMSMPLIAVNYADFAKLVSAEEEPKLRETMSLRRPDGTLKDLFEMRFLSPILAKPYARLAYSKNCACEGFYENHELRERVTRDVVNGVQAVGLKGRFECREFVPAERLSKKVVR